MECQDGAAPVGFGLDLQAFGDIVTENYELPACQKSVFVWSAELADSGVGGLFLRLCGNGCTVLVSEFPIDSTVPMEGEALQPVDQGIYYLVSKGSFGRHWSVRWECRD